MSHSRCFAQTKQDLQGTPLYSQIVGHLSQKDDGQMYMTDCDGNEIPLALVFKKYLGAHICINFNNLSSPSGPWGWDVHYEGK